MTDQSIAPKGAPAPMTLTERAAKRIAFLKRQENTDAHVRLAVNGGGCSGFSYAFSFDSAVNEDDVLIARDGASLVIDTTSLELLAGSELDYVDDLSASAFRINNPNASASCGCGSSFAV